MFSTIPHSQSSVVTPPRASHHLLAALLRRHYHLQHLIEPGVDPKHRRLFVIVLSSLTNQDFLSSTAAIIRRTVTTLAIMRIFRALLLKALLLRPENSHNR